MNDRLMNLIRNIQNPKVRQVMGVAGETPSKKIVDTVTDGGVEIIVNYILELERKNGV